jgi:hypothetical protein
MVSEGPLGLLQLDPGVSRGRKGDTPALRYSNMAVLRMRDVACECSDQILFRSLILLSNVVGVRNPATLATA